MLIYIYNNILYTSIYTSILSTSSILTIINIYKLILNYYNGIITTNVKISTDDLLVQMGNEGY